MRWSTIVFLVFVTASRAAAQVNDAGATVVRSLPTVVSPIAPVPYGLSNSVIDHKGRLLIFDVTFDYPTLSPGPPVAFRLPPTTKTKVTIIENDGTKHDSTYSGSFQVVGTGRYAVYAIVTDNALSGTSTQAPVVITRHVVAVGAPFPTLPAVDLPAGAQIKVSAVGDDAAAAPDMIAAVSSSPVPVIFPPTGIMAPLPSMPTQARSVQMFQFDGISFKALTPTPVPVP